MSQLLKSFGCLTGGALGALVLVLSLGLFKIQAVGLRGGAVFDLQNVLVSVQPPIIPYWQYLTIAALATVAILAFFVWPSNLVGITRWSLTAGFLLVLLGLTILGLIWEYQNGPALANNSGPPLGWRGWLQYGGASSATHVVLLFGFISLIPGQNRTRGLKLRQAEPMQGEPTESQDPDSPNH